MQSPAPLPEAWSREVMEVAMNILLLGILAACVLLTLLYVVALAVSVISEVRRSQTQRNVLPR